MSSEARVDNVALWDDGALSKEGGTAGRILRCRVAATVSAVAGHKTMTLSDARAITWSTVRFVHSGRGDSLAAEDDWSTKERGTSS